MIETFTALMLAHLLADFVLQSSQMADAKQIRHPGWLVAHISLVGATAVVALGALGWPILILMLAHLAIDIGKSLAPQWKLTPFLLDQGAHLVSLVALAWWAPDLWASGLWADLTWLPGIGALTAGLILATRAGGFALACLMAPLEDPEVPKGLKDGGKIIGWLERGMIFILVMVGQPAGIGFLIAAKSLLRFDTVSNNQKAAEYVIIGTLASFGWALLAGYGTIALLQHLPPLGIPLQTP